ncbi:MAG TPA: histidinol-phosphate transaminase [Candidatus Limnocylindrales bacterium]|nr:histidinol-phosphate transaminase [Candidatus Limnocylindrales bacterium]
MSPTPVTFTSPDQPAAYSWEATNEEVAARYGVPLESVVRFDLNTAAAPPAMAQAVLDAGRFDMPMSEYPPADYRRLIAAGADRYGVGIDEIVVGAGADEVLDIIGKVFLPEGSTAVVSVPTYAMFRVITEQRRARALAVPRLGPAEGHALDLPAVREAAREASVVWLCSPNNPTALAEPDGAIQALLGQIAADASAARREPPIVVVDEAYAEFAGRSVDALRFEHPNLITIRTASKAYALAGLRVGFGIARPEVVARMNPFRPPGSVSTVSVTVVTEALLDPTLADSNVRRVSAERDRLTAALTEAGWSVGPSMTNFILVDFGSVERAAAVAEGLLGRGLVPRAFPATHPLADHLRLTVRDGEQDDRLIAAARELEAG